MEIERERKNRVRAIYCFGSLAVCTFAEIHAKMLTKWLSCIARAHVQIALIVINCWIYGGWCKSRPWGRKWISNMVFKSGTSAISTINFSLGLSTFDRGTHTCKQHMSRLFLAQNTLFAFQSKMTGNVWRSLFAIEKQRESLLKLFRKVSPITFQYSIFASNRFHTLDFKRSALRPFLQVIAMICKKNKFFGRNKVMNAKNSLIEY